MQRSVMKLSARPMDLDAGGKFIVTLHRDDADEMGLKSLERVRITKGRFHILGIADITEKLDHKGTIGTSKDVTSKLGLSHKDKLDVLRAREPDSVRYIKERIENHRLPYRKIKSIVDDVAHRRLSRTEIAGFLTAIHINPLNLEEITSITKCMSDIGGQLDLNVKGPIFDKHSVGGVCGDKTTMVVVPMAAAAGLVIPKTSSRAITSPAGTADRVEVLTNVDLGVSEVKRVVEKTKGCMVWGGAVDLAPADDVFIQVEYPLGIDPLLLPSVISKKKAVGAQRVVIDIPRGIHAKVKTPEESKELSVNFIELGKRLNMEVRCAITNGMQPIGRGVGPALEAREALQTLTREAKPTDLIDKATTIAGMLVELSGKKNGKAHALKMITSGKAEKKMRQIIGAQGGNAKIRSKDIPLGDYKVDIKSTGKGHVVMLRNQDIASIARAAGCPKDKGAGIYLHKKMGEPVKVGTKLFTIYSEKQSKLNDALDVLKTRDPVIVGKTDRMLLRTYPGVREERYFFLES